MSPQFGALEGVPAGSEVVFLGDVIVARGVNFAPDMKVFFGLNHDLAYVEDSLMTLDRAALPDVPFVYTDPVTLEQTILEVEAPIEYKTIGEIRVTIPAALACSPFFNNPIVRLFANGESSIPLTDIYWVVGPRCIALTPSSGLDIGGESVIVHGDFFSPYTQIAIRYQDPSGGGVVVRGDELASDIEELFVDRHTMIVPQWPAIVPSSTNGIATDIAVDILLFESIDDINGSLVAEPGLGGSAPCDPLLPESPAIPLFRMGVRNSQALAKYTYLPTGTTDYPSIAGLLPESGSEAGGNTVVLHGDQFDAFTADLSNPSDPGVAVECPPGSNDFIPALSATLVDRHTLVIRMPPCPVDLPGASDIALRNRYSMDNPGPDGQVVIFEDVYTYLPIPPISPPVVTAIYPSAGGAPLRGMAHDYGLERLLIVGDGFDADTTLNGGVEFVLPDDPANPPPTVGGGNPQIVTALRVILHNRNLIEVYTRRLPAPYYPLQNDVLATLRVRNGAGASDYEDAMQFLATPNVGVTPVLDEVIPDQGPTAGGNEVVIKGDNFDTSSQVWFGGLPATTLQFINESTLIARVPNGTGTVEVTVRDGALWSDPVDYDYITGPGDFCPVVAWLEPDSGSHVGGYSILAYGGGFSPTTSILFGTANPSPDVYFVSNNLVRVEVPEALPEQIGADVETGAIDLPLGCVAPIHTVDFFYFAAQQAAPEILFVTSARGNTLSGAPVPALAVGGGDRMLVVGSGFDQRTTFAIAKPEVGDDEADASGIEVLDPNLAIVTAPESPDEDAGPAQLIARNDFGDSSGFDVEYVALAPVIFDVRNLDDGSNTAPIDAEDRIVIYGDNFFRPLTIRLTGCNPDYEESGENGNGEEETTITLTLDSPGVTLVEDHLLGLDIPDDTFCEGLLVIEVETNYGTARFENDQGDPVFLLIGPQPPVIDGVFPSRFNSGGGQEAIFIGRFLTSSTELSVKTDPMMDWEPVLGLRIVSENVALATMPPLAGGVPPDGIPGDVLATETNPILAAKIPKGPTTIMEELYTVVDDEAPALRGVFPDEGSVDGGEQVLLFGQNFLTALGEPNVTTVYFRDPITDDVLVTFTRVTGNLPVTTPGEFAILNDHTILLITAEYERLEPEDEGAPMVVEVVAPTGSSQLVGGFTYVNTPALRTPVLMGITPNETRLNGGTSHLLSGGFLTEADRIIFSRTTPAASVTLSRDDGDFAQVEDSFLVFVMPDLSGTFEAGDVLTVRAEKDVNGTTLVSNALTSALRVTFAGPPVIDPILDPDAGSGFGGGIVTLEGSFFTPNSQVLFGTMPARHVVFVDVNTLIAISPTLPVDVPNPGLDLSNLHTMSGTVDVAVFTQGGWAVLEDGFTFEPEAPTVLSWSPDEAAEGETVRVTVLGTGFVPGLTTAVADDGFVTNLVVESLERISFDYTADTYAQMLGPVTDEITISTNLGTAADKVEMTIHLAPYITDCETSYPLNDHSAPTTGVSGGQFVVVTVYGGNFREGGMLGVLPRVANAPIQMKEIGSATPFTKQAQFRVIDSEMMEFSVPNVFSASQTTLVDGNPNLGPAMLIYTGPSGQVADHADCFRYVPVFYDFTDYRFEVPAFFPGLSAPGKVTIGDVNADGVNDAVVMAQQTIATDILRPAEVDTEVPEAYLYLADTFGPGVDVNGDGKAPDFAGTFTVIEINHDQAQTWVPERARGQDVLLANLDDDDQLEIIVPVIEDFGDTFFDPVMLVDIEEDGSLGRIEIERPGYNAWYTAGIAVGNFDVDPTATDSAGDRDYPDIAVLYGNAIFSSDRKLVIYKSRGAFVYEPEIYDIGDFNGAWGDYLQGALAAGDFDGDGDDDLIWGQYRSGPIWDPENDPEDLEILVAEVDAANGTIEDVNSISNFSGSSVPDIDIFDADGDGLVDAVVLIRDYATGALVGDQLLGGGFATILDPLGSLTADEYMPTPYRVNFNSLRGNGIGLAHGDINGDGEDDVAVVNDDGEILAYLGMGDGSFMSSGRSWQVVTGSTPYERAVQGIGVGDFNGDGIAEILVGDMTAAPYNVVFWLNSSR